MKEPIDYSSGFRKAKTHTIINAFEFISILRGEHQTYIKDINWVKIENHIITGVVRLKGITIKNKLAVTNCCFEGHVILEGSKFEEIAVFSDCYFENLFSIDNCEFKNRFEIYGIHIPSLWIEGGIFEEIVLRGYSDLKSVWVLGGKFKEFSFINNPEDAQLDEFVIYNKGSLSGNIRLEAIVSNKISLAGINPGSNEILVEGAKCNHFVFGNFSNAGVMKIFGLEPISKRNSYFEVVKSNLGRAQFYRMALDKFGEVIVVDSFIAECNMINCEWRENFRGVESPNYYATEVPRPLFAEKERKQLRESFRQLKFLYDKQGDKINELLFYSREMNVYNSLIPWREIWYKPFSETFWEKLIITSSKYFSNYGTSFLVPLLGILAMNLLILIILIECFNYSGLELAGFSWGERDANRTAIGQFFTLINPLHKIDAELNGWAVFWDLCSRISASYFVYQLIRASRRFLR